MELAGEHVLGLASSSEAARLAEASDQHSGNCCTALWERPWIFRADSYSGPLFSPFAYLFTRMSLTYSVFSF